MIHQGSLMRAAMHPPIETAVSGAVRLANVSFDYASASGRTRAVSGITASFTAGKFVSIIGPSGCGKSTILSLISGFLKPTEGKIVLDGEDITGPSSERSVVFQNFSLFPWKTVDKNIEFSFRMRGIDHYSRVRATRNLLAACGLEKAADKYPHQLSGGMQQRVAIVRAMAAKPKVLLMDEPFGALDAQTRVRMQNVLLRVWEGLRISVLFVTHDIEEAIYLSDRVIVMAPAPGRLIADIPVPFERPRDAKLTTSVEFNRLKSQASDLIHMRAAAVAAPDAGDLDFPPNDTAIRGQDVAAIINFA
jgi:NitT/TauT family transport system ATP-binding protein